MPLSDWQFWVVSLIALGAIARVAWVFAPRKCPKTVLTISAGRS